MGGLSRAADRNADPLALSASLWGAQQHADAPSDDHIHTGGDFYPGAKCDGDSYCHSHIDSYGHTDGYCYSHGDGHIEPDAILYPFAHCDAQADGDANCHADKHIYLDAEADRYANRHAIAYPYDDGISYYERHRDGDGYAHYNHHPDR